MTTTHLHHPVTARAGLTRPGAGRAPTRRPEMARPGLAPPEAVPIRRLPRTALGARWRGAWQRMQRFVLSTADDCPVMLLPIAHRN